MLIEFKKGKIERKEVEMRLTACFQFQLESSTFEGCLIHLLTLVSLASKSWFILKTFNISSRHFFSFLEPVVSQNMCLCVKEGVLNSESCHNQNSL